MKRTAYLVLIATVLVAAILLCLLERSAGQLSGVMPVAVRIEYYKLYVDLAKSVLVGFGAVLLGILIPAVFAETRYSFERLRDSRTAYSEAKTGVVYLSLRLCTLNLKDAAALVQQAHVRKHEAELYTELKFHLKHIHKTPEKWSTEVYGCLSAAREVLKKHAGEWDALGPAERLVLLQSVHAAEAHIAH